MHFIPSDNQVQRHEYKL